MLYLRVGRSPAIQFPTHAKHLHGCRTAAGVHVNLSQQTAILHADGDFMGQTIDQQSRHAKGAEKHREISRRLDSFAREARDIVEKHIGAPVYTGGDDVLAFMPLHTVLACAQKLAKEFAERLAPFTYDEK